MKSGAVADARRCQTTAEPRGSPNHLTTIRRGEGAGDGVVMM